MRSSSLRILFLSGWPLFAAAQNPAAQIDRVQLEQQVRARVYRALKEQVGLTDTQIARVEDVNRRIEVRRGALETQERQARVVLRDEITLGDSSRNAAIGQELERLFKAQRERVLLNEEEQKELAQFLTPLQRARYFSIEEVIRRRVRQMMQQSADSAGSSRVGRPALGPPS